MDEGWLTLGIEEEFQIVDPQTWELRSHVSELLASSAPTLGEQIKREMHQSIVEVGTTVCHSAAEAGAELKRLRRVVMDIAAKEGLVIAAAGTHPFSSWLTQEITPLERYGVKVISIQFFVPEGQPIVWRGPLVGGAIQQFLRDVEWGDLDYLIVDQPPGTSDAQLTLAQSIPISGTLLVTTPQEVALLDVRKALAMLRRMSVPVIGVVENMGSFACVHCGEVTEIFGRGGGERFAAQNQLEYLGGIPLDVTVRQGGDVGVPAVAQREPGPAARALTDVARTIAARMSVRAAAAAGQPVLTIS